MAAPPFARNVCTLDDVTHYLAGPRVYVPIATLYLVGLALVATALVLLQVIYLGMILLAGYGTWRYVLLLPGILTAAGVNQITVILGITPIVAGIVVTFFLLKPILARPPRRPAGFHMTRSGQPVLFAFVDRLCDLLGSPRPRAIEMDLNVNAALSRN